MEQQQHAAVAAEDSKVPKLLWFAVVVFLANLVLLISVCMSPELRVNMYGEIRERTVVAAGDKPSPFPEPATTKKSKKARGAAKLRPVVFQLNPGIGSSDPNSIRSAALLD